MLDFFAVNRMTFQGSAHDCHVSGKGLSSVFIASKSVLPKFVLSGGTGRWDVHRPRRLCIRPTVPPRPTETRATRADARAYMRAQRHEKYKKKCINHQDEVGQWDGFSNINACSRPTYPSHLDAVF